MPPWVKIGLIALQGLQVAFLLLHDWIPLGRLNNLRAVRVSDPPRKLLMVTLLSAFPFALVFGASYAYWDSPRWPMWLQMWLWCTYGAAFLGTILAWWGHTYCGEARNARTATSYVLPGHCGFFRSGTGLLPMRFTPAITCASWAR